MSSEPREFIDARPNRLFFKHIIRKVFLEDWVIKLVALAITIALWVGVTGLSTPWSERYTVPLNLRISDSFVITNSPVQEVEVRVTGDKRKIEQIKESDLRVLVDLSDVPPGDRVLQLTPENVSIDLPTGVKLNEIQPNKIAVRLENVEEKEVEVRVETEGEIPEGFELYTETVAPQKVRVRGPASFIRSLNFVSTEKVNLEDSRSDFTARQVPINVSNPKATLLETVVDVAFRIGEKRVERIYLVKVKNDPDRKATVVLFGGKSLFDAVKADDLLVEITDGASEPKLILPPGLDGKVEVRNLKLSS